MLSKRSSFNFINAVSVKSSILEDNYINHPNKLSEFQSIRNGIPILVEADPFVFEFTKEETFIVPHEKICELIYGFVDLNYVGFKHAFEGNRFLTNLRIRENLKNEFSKLVNKNLCLMDLIKKLESSYDLVGAFQTRNIPHSGHEIIIEEMLKIVDHLVINPVVGPKKPGDVTLEALENVYKQLAKTKYSNKISFFPIYANMFYAGPREAVHHAKIRSKLGFGLFSVGRDHAGAEGRYEDEAASNAVEKWKDHLGIQILAHKGAAHCVSCDKFVLVGSCGCSENNLRDIAGTDFRKAIKMRRYFRDADPALQEYLFKSSIEVFEK